MNTYKTLEEARIEKGSVAHKIIKINHKNKGICYIGSKVPAKVLAEMLINNPMPEILDVIDDYDNRTDEQVKADNIKLQTKTDSERRCERCGEHVDANDYHQTENSRWGKVTAYYCKSCAALLGQIGAGEYTAMQDRQETMADNTLYTKAD